MRFSYEQAFMFFLPRICEHCLNPSCVASCPSGAMYKRAEDGIVLVDQDQCRGWRMCVTGCPYKKVYFNHRTGKAEKCTFCYPRIEVGLPTVCSETCVGRLRYIGLFLYDVDRVTAAASVEDEQDLYEAQLDLLLDPNDPAVIDQARRDGIGQDWIVAAQRSPVYKLAKDYRVALPLHPEFRTMPMVWYIPPLSPVVDRLTETGHDGEDAGNLFGAIDALRIPVEYLAELFTAGDPEPVRGVLQKLAAMRSYMRDVTLDRPRNESVATAVGMTGRRDRRDVPAARDRQVRGALRHPHRLRGRGPPARGAGLQPRRRRRARHGRQRPVRRGLRITDARVGGDLPRLAEPADQRPHRRPRRTAAPGSTCSTGTARVAHPGCSRRPTRRRRPRRHHRERSAVDPGSPGAQR